MSQKQAMVCSNSKCGRSFTEPVRLTVIQADGSPEIQDACPYCFSQVNLEKGQVEETETSSDKSKKDLKNRSKKSLREKANGVEKDKPAGCAHFLGYLKTRSKGSAIPDDCLLCRAIMECL